MELQSKIGNLQSQISLLKSRLLPIQDYSDFNNKIIKLESKLSTLSDYVSNFKSFTDYGFNRMQSQPTIITTNTDKIIETTAKITQLSNQLAIYQILCNKYNKTM